MSDIRPGSTVRHILQVSKDHDTHVGVVTCLETFESIEGSERFARVRWATPSGSVDHETTRHFLFELRAID